jgi:hypothetical protein
MKGQHYLLERTGVGITEKVVDKRRVLPVGLGPVPVRDPGGLNHPLVPAEVIYQPDKALVQDRKFLVQNRFCIRRYTMSHISPCMLYYAILEKS